MILPLRGPGIGPPSKQAQSPLQTIQLCVCENTPFPRMAHSLQFECQTLRLATSSQKRQSPLFKRKGRREERREEEGETGYGNSFHNDVL